MVQIRYLTLFLPAGGEPFLIPNIIEACKAITKKHYVNLVTNLSSEKCEEFCKTIDPGRVTRILASLHINELIKHNLLDRYIDHFRLFKERGFNIYAYEVGHPALMNKAVYYKKFFKEKGIELTFGHFVGSHKRKTYPYDYTAQEIETFGGFEKLKLYLESFQREKLCNAGYNIFVATESGGIQACYKIDEKRGHIYDRIEFRDNLSRCPPGICLGAIKFCDTYLFEKARKECATVRKYRH